MDFTLLRTSSSTLLGSILVSRDLSLSGVPLLIGLAYGAAYRSSLELAASVTTRELLHTNTVNGKKRRW